RERCVKCASNHIAPRARSMLRPHAEAPMIKRTCGLGIAIAVFGPILANCGGQGMPSVPGGGKCPNLADIEEGAKFDWGGTFKIEAQAGAKIKNGVIAAVELKEFSDKVDADLKTACGGIAKDLGHAGEPKNGEEACKLAMKAIGDAKAKIGA